MNEYDEDFEDLQKLAESYGGEIVEPELFAGATVSFDRDDYGFWSAFVEHAGTRRRLERSDLMGEVRSAVEYDPDEGSTLDEHFDRAIFGLILTPTDLIAVDAATDG